MKRTFLLLSCLLVLNFFSFAEDFSTSDVAVYNEVVSAYQTGFYPGAIEKANLLEKKYPGSVYLLPAQILKAEAQIITGNFDESLETLNLIIVKLHSGSEDFSKVNYLLGKANYETANYNKALQYLHTSCASSFANESMTYYYPSLLYSARIFVIKEEYDQALPMLEYIVKNGHFYGLEDYTECVQKLFSVYNKTRNYEKAVALYNKFSSDDFNNDVYTYIVINAAEAYENLKDYETAYKLYSKVVEAGNNLAVIALKKAYIMAGEPDCNIEPDTVFAKANEIFKAQPQLLNEFWIRLGIDKYEKKDYASALDYFAKASEKDIAIVTLYKARIVLDTRKTKDDEKKAEDLLDSIKDNVKESDIENLDFSYISLQLQCKALNGAWSSVQALYEQLEKPSLNDTYYYAASYYYQKNYDKTESILNYIVSGDVKPEIVKFFELYSQALINQKKYSEANAVYGKIEKANCLSDKSAYEFAKSLFAEKKYQEAYSKAMELKSGELDYFKGICQINLRNWKKAKEHFVEYIKNYSNKDNFNTYALFYKGYAEYNLEEYKNSYASFIRYGSEASGNVKSYVRKAYDYAAKSALQSGDVKNAAVQAENLIKNSTTIEEKQQSVMFASEIYTDLGTYDKALEVLSGYDEDASDFAMEARFQKARIYVKQNKIKTAEDTYKIIYTDYPDTVYAQNAMYRCAEMYYSAGDYNTAESYFNNYIYKFVNGIYVDSAFFFCADCNFRLGLYDKSIMLNENFLQKSPSSIYAYGAYKNLLESYYAREDYEKAYSTAQKMVKDFSSQAKADGISRRVLELEKIVSGIDTRIAEKLSQYEKAGKSESKNGRIVGSELVQLYAADSETQKEAFELALEIFEKQTDSTEIYYAAQNAEYIAEYYRKNQENKKSADFYLKAAEYYRSVAGEDASVASVLYGAAEAFIAARLKGDAKETAELLIKLYPQSQQAKRVVDLIK